jgi:hypothetical protein
MKTAAFASIWIFTSLGAGTADWTPAVEVRHEETLCLTYQARVDGGFLLVRAAIEPGWHTFAMDNKRRAEEKLAGRRSLGIDRPTEFVLAGLETVGPWYQSPPKDFSRPELRSFTWGFEREAIFAAKVKRAGTAPAEIKVRGQACTETTCKNIDATISIPLSGANWNGAAAVNLSKMVQVR